MTPTEDMVNQIDEVLRQHAELAGRSQYSDLSDLKAESKVLATRLQALLDRITPPSSTYGKAAEAARSLLTHVKIEELVGVCEAMRADLQNGWVRSFFELVHADTFAEILEMAADLLESGYKDASAVMAGTALEVHLRSLALKHAVEIAADSGRSKKADTLNAELKKSGAYSGIQQKQVTAWLGLRNSAAHGEYADYSESEVANLVRDVGQFISAYPA